jgi:aspartate kinase
VNHAGGAPLAVLKFGGSSFATPHAYHRVARYLAARVAQGERLCVIVSVMSGTTGRLSELLHAIVPSPQAEDVDATLGTGEILAAALVRATLVANGVAAISLNAFQLGWRARGNFTAGRLADIPADAITDALQRAPVVVISGGQATSEDGRLVMLGRNSSDLTAIAVAAALQCESATIFSDVEGVFTADPFRLASASLIPQLGYRYAKAYSEWGAKVLHAGCVAFAERHGVLIRCASLDADGQAHFGTRITHEGNGVQVCLPEHLVICRPGCGRAAFVEAIGPLGPAGECVPVVGMPDACAVLPDDRYRSLVAAGIAVTVENLLPIAAFHFDGRLSVHAAPREHRDARAQALHDALVGEARFPKPTRLPEKGRGSHSAVFGSLVREAAL